MSAELTDLLEENEQPVEVPMCTCSFRPFEIKTLCTDGKDTTLRRS